MGSKSDIALILLILGIVIAAYLILKKMGIGISDAVKQKLKDVSSSLETVSHQTPGSYDTFLGNLNPITSTAVQAGNVIAPTPILTASAQLGYDVGISIIEARGTLRQEDIPAYNALSEADRFEYNTWAASQWTGGSEFHYAPSPSIWNSNPITSSWLSPITSWW